MHSFSELLAPALLWLPASVWIFAACALVAIVNRPLGRARWLLAAWILCAPLLYPREGDYQPITWGILATVLTSSAIIAAARLPDLDHGLRISRRRLTVFVWLTLPVVRLSDPSPKYRNWRAIRRYLALALLKKGSWEVIFWGMSYIDGSQVPWPIRSALLMTYFVLNLTALHDAAAAACNAFGFAIDELFDAPLLATSVRDFWSRRWNKFINRFALKYVALPNRNRLPSFATLLLVFGCSGLFHEYFAWGVGGTQAKNGLMMLFFLIQGVAVWLTSKVERKLPEHLTNILTFVWMALSAPLFFGAVEPALRAFVYPPSWYPWSGL